MPKETTRGLAGGYDVRVGWMPEPTGHVEVGVETAAGHSLLTMLYGDNQQLERIGKMLEQRGWPMPDRDTGNGDSSEETAEDRRVAGRGLLDLIEGAIGPVDPENYSYTSVWASLDRAGCNRLIKIVRRARDAAFGRDE